MAPQDTFHEHTQFRPDVLPYRPVNRQVPLDRLHEFSGYGLEFGIPKNRNRAVVHFERLVEGRFVGRETQRLSPALGLSHLLREGN